MRAMRPIKHPENGKMIVELPGRNINPGTGARLTWNITIVFFLFLIPLLIPFKLFCSGEPARKTPLSLYSQLREIKLTDEAVMVRDLTLVRDIATFTFKEGIFYFLEPVENQYTGAIFIGQGEFFMQPVQEIEQNHLKHLTATPYIKETFSKILLRFTDNGKTYKKITSQGSPPPSPEISTAQAFHATVRKHLRKGRAYLHNNTASSIFPYNLALRLLQDMTWEDHKEYFFSYFDGAKYGDMLFLIDPLGAPIFDSQEEVIFACLKPKNLGVWTSQHLKEYYQTPTTYPSNELVDVEHYDINATLEDEVLDARVTVRFKAKSDGARVLPFNLYRFLRVATVTDDKGTALDYIQENEKKDPDFAVILPTGLKKGEHYSITFEYSGKKVFKEQGSGNLALYVRSTWYPFRTFQDRATYRLTFKVPKSMIVTATGWLEEEKIEKDTLISRWKSDVPLSVAGFNCGIFNKVTVPKNQQLGVTIDAYVNKELPDFVKQFNLGNNSFDTNQMAGSVLEEAKTAAMLYEKLYGPTPYDRLSITQQPQGHFGQSWPMLVYMPIIAYFKSFNYQGMKGTKDFQRFVCAHEIAHQWWGNSVGAKSYRDRWLEEGLAEFSASLFAHLAYKQKEFIAFWKEHRLKLLKKNNKRLKPGKVGSITLGRRLSTARTGSVSNTVIYSKGAFIIQMLKRLMWNSKTGDSRFFAMLKDFMSTYSRKEASTDDFKAIVEKHMTGSMDLDKNRKMNWFFNQWVYGTTIPHYSLKYKLKKEKSGKYSLSFTVSQEKVSDSFKMRVPVYLDYGGGKFAWLCSVVLKGNRSIEKKVPFLFPKKPKRILLCAFEDVLCTID